MAQPFSAIKISRHVYWVGAIDWTIRNFHGYATHRGSTYNAYLVMGEKPVLVDTVKKPFLSEMMARIASVVPPDKIETILSNHAEMDHTGALPETIERVKPKQVFASPNGVKALENHFHWNRELTPVKDGETLTLGDRTLAFVMTPMLHWPDSMFTYLPEDKLLFSQDAFGMHLASTERFADRIDADVLKCEAASYYANILLPLSKFVARLIEKLPTLDLAIEIVAPDHGPIWRKDLDRIIGWYADWSAQKPTRKAVIIYDTMWGSTDLMARTIAEGLLEGGSSVKVLRMTETHRSDVAAEILDAGAILVGSPTLNNNIFPTLGDVLTYLKGLKPANRIGAVFGSYGWSGEAVKLLGQWLSDMQIEVVAEPVKSRFAPDESVLAQCRALGRTVAQTLQQRFQVAT